MLTLQTELEGKHAQFGFLRENLKHHGFTLGSYWEYDRGFFDAVLTKEEGETIYLRLPFKVTTGMLDSDNAYVKFLKPYVIKHVVHLGLEHDGSSLLDSTGISQFQTPIDKDAEIQHRNKWVAAGEEVVEKVVQYLN